MPSRPASLRMPLACAGPVGQEFRDTGEQRYEADAPVPATTKSSAFSSQGKARETEVQNRQNERVKLRTDYNNRYQFAGNVFAEDTIDYVVEQQRWVDTKLPEYEEKIANARTDAQHALEEEVIHRLRERLREVKRQFNDLNSALEGLEFSKRSYKFTYRVREEYRRFYEMVMEAGQLENQPLFEANWHREYGSGPLQDLLNEILGERGQCEIKDLSSGQITGPTSTTTSRSPTLKATRACSAARLGLGPAAKRKHPITLLC